MDAARALVMLDKCESLQPGAAEPVMASPPPRFKPRPLEGAAREVTRAVLREEFEALGSPVALVRGEAERLEEIRAESSERAAEWLDGAQARRSHAAVREHRGDRVWAEDPSCER